MKIFLRTLNEQIDQHAAETDPDPVPDIPLHFLTAPLHVPVTLARARVQDHRCGDSGLRRNGATGRRRVADISLHFLTPSKAAITAGATWGSGNRPTKNLRTFALNPWSLDRVRGDRNGIEQRGVPDISLPILTSACAHDAGAVQSRRHAVCCGPLDLSGGRQICYKAMTYS